MSDIPIPKLCYIVCMVLGFGLLSARWIFFSVEIAGFFLVLLMLFMTILRWRIPRLRWTLVADGVVCVIFYPWTVVIAMFAGMYYRLYFMAVLVVPVLVFFDAYLAAASLLAGLCGAFLGLWERERERRLEWRDKEVGRYYELEALQSDLFTATRKIEQMTVVSERARIAREIHDNAGHEIVAAYISLQTAREAMDNPDRLARALPLYDAALERLDNGVNKIREAVHNLAPVAMLGVDALKEKCENFPANKIDKGIKFSAFGDTSDIPVHVWNVLEACLNEALTNVTRHARPSFVDVNLDATPRLVRLYIENDGVPAGGAPANQVRPGSGLRNIRHRISAVGGSLSVDADAGGRFRVVCVIPVHRSE
ncbi:MAG: histidine kinase [Oscillospiraceae bacterium]|nr:histidine kinase [Oscillospiraceae bacterium]